MDENTDLPDAGTGTGTGQGSRRALLAAGTTAALGAVGVALARPAEAAAGQPLLLGRANTSGAVATSVTSSTTGSAFSVTATAGHGLIGITKLNSKFGHIARNDATTVGGGGALLGDGRTNAGVVGRCSNPITFGIVGLNTAATAGGGGGVLADGGVGFGLVAFNTSAPATPEPALVADGSVSTWGSWVLGDEQVDGALFATFSLVGTETPAGVRYREAVSGDAPTHTIAGVLTLGANGTGTVPLPQTYLDSAQVSAAAVLLSAMNTAMPNLAATLVGGSFTVTGGVPNGQVSWQVVAPRNVPGAAIPLAAARAAASPGRLALGRRTGTRPPRANPALKQG